MRIRLFCFISLL